MSERKRNNSLIPIEFRKDTSDGGIERAALATVFGVKEYTESKIFWNADEENSTEASPTETTRSMPVRNSPQISRTSLPLIPVVSGFDDFWSETYFSISQPLQNTNSDQDIPDDLSNLPCTFFDLIQSDENPNIIIWNDQPTFNPQEDTKKKGLISSAQQILSDSFKLRKKASMHKLAAKNQDDLLVCEPFRIIEAATIEKLVEKLTISLDYAFMTDFFLIFRVFMTPMQLCKFLILRFKWSLENNDENRCIVRIRTFVVMRHWLLNYFLHDFIPNKDLRSLFTSFLNEMPFHPVIRQSIRDQRIIKGLKRVVRRLKKIYYASSSSERVKVIDPPKTIQQEQIKALVQEKLCQNTIRQKTLNIVNGIYVDNRHSNNTAVRDKHSAPVIVIGNYPSAANNNSTAEKRRLGLSNISTPKSIDNPSSASLPSHNETVESESIKLYKKKSAQFYKSNFTDNSLDSDVSPGTSVIDENESGDEAVYLHSPSESGTSLVETEYQDSQKPQYDDTQITSDKLTEKLERIRQQQLHQEDDEIKRAQYFLSNYRYHPEAITEAALSTFHHTNEYCPVPFYSAQLAIPSNMTTPDTIYPPSRTPVNDTSNDIIHTEQHKLNSSTSYESMGYPSITDSEVVTPPNVIADISIVPKHRYSYGNFQLNQPNVESSNRTSGSTFIDPRVKPLPRLILDDNKNSEDSSEDNSRLEHTTISYPSYARRKPLPNTNDDHAWKYSAPKKTPLKSRIMEIDVNPNIIPPSLLTLKHMENGPVILNYPTSLIAQQLCLIEKSILLDINWEELVDCRWTRMSTSSLYQPTCDGESNEANASYLQGTYSRSKRMKQQHEKNDVSSERGIEKAINRFNAVCQWVSSEIVQTKQLNQRAKVIEKFIRIAKKCKLYCNFTTLIQILLGLQSSSVSRLDKTWSRVDKRILKILHELCAFTSPTKNWKHMRDSMTQVAEEFGESPTEIQVEIDNGTVRQQQRRIKNSVTIKLPFGGCIPFLGIYLSDLVFNAELPTYLPSPEKTYRTNTMENIVLSQPLVHFRKHRITATIIKRVLLFQNLAKRYSFVETTDSLLFSTCLQVPSLDTDTIQKLSHEIEPPSNS